MMHINWKLTMAGSMEETISLVTRALQREGFGVLTRIDLHQKFQEKLSKTIPPAVILGACAPDIAYEAYVLNSDVASLLPCNVVVREVDQKTVSVEIARPSAMMAIIGDRRLSELSKEADLRLEGVFKLIQNAAATRKEQAESGASIKNIEEECWDREGRWGICREDEKIEKNLREAG
ncbi:MAG: DUF302 domain-containing protein [Bdellovibrionota bacterium]